ncbi:MAG: hypothetical protein ACODAA_07000, partial [Gemmatimonadota bacterium]
MTGASPASDAAPRIGRVASLWAVSGVAALFAWAVIRLGWYGVVTIREGLDPVHWLALGGLTVAFVYGEGYRALERRWVPHLYRRARALRTESSAAVRLLAPLHGLSLIAASRRHLLRAWLGTLAIVGAVFVVRALPTPWRGIIDFAVAAALLWG